MAGLHRKAGRGGDDEGEDGKRRAVGWGVCSLVLGAILAIPGAWMLAAQTFEPGISLSSASSYFEKFNTEVLDPTERQSAWDTMVTTNYRRYSGFNSSYAEFSRFWGHQNRPAISHISKDGKSTFSVSLVFFPKSRGEKGLQPSKFAAVFACDDWQARWTFKGCDSDALRLDDVKHYDYRVVEG